MTDLQTETSELPSLAARQDAFRPGQAFRSFGLSFFINGLCPFLLYKYLEPKFPGGAVQPLLFASVFPVFGLLFGIVRKRMVDFIALIALFEISLNIGAIFVTPSIKWALVARSLNGLITATVFLISALIGRPIIFFIARQFVAAGDPQRIKGFDAVNAADRGRTFFISTMVWAVAIYCLSTLNAALALTLEPATYLLVSQVTSMTINISLIIWSIRFSRARLAPQVAAA
jgi:hypothetical protein